MDTLLEDGKRKSEREREARDKFVGRVLGWRPCNWRNIQEKHT